jgi:hypothetical protein
VVWFIFVAVIVYTNVLCSSSSSSSSLQSRPSWRRLSSLSLPLPLRPCAFLAAFFFAAGVSSVGLGGSVLFFTAPAVFFCRKLRTFAAFLTF